jgi:hypothetical protein
MKKALLTLLLSPIGAFAQESMTADVMRSDGKIYVVITVAAIVIAIAGIYMISIDRKVSQLERKLNSKK